MPSAIDAVVLQAVVDYLQPSLMAAAPTGSAYYSRSHQPPSVAAIDDSFSYAWWELWPEFQERIWDFADKYAYVAMTDVGNYFESIPLDRLRNRITAFGAFNETVVDFLFYMLDAFVWRPEYRPASGVGLPQINFDAPRLLAHAYLYSLDQLLEELSNGDFVRWMDDINFAVGSPSKGKRHLALVDARLAAHGLHLNPAKTGIRSAREVLAHLWVNENRRITLLERLLANATDPDTAGERIAAYAYKRFRDFYRKPRLGVWEKVLRRYLSLFSRTGHRGPLPLAPELLANCPGVRDKVFALYRSVGYSPSRFRVIETFLVSDDCTDDVARFQACKLLTDWMIPVRSSYCTRATRLARVLLRGSPESVSAFAGGLWLTAKYGSGDTLASYLRVSGRVWRRSEWCARQAAAVWPLLPAPEQGQLVAEVRESGLLDGLSVLASLRAMERAAHPDRQLRSYVTYEGSAYTLPKFIIAALLLTTVTRPSDRAALRESISPAVRDPVYRHRLGLSIVGSRVRGS